MKNLRSSCYRYFYLFAYRRTIAIAAAPSTTTNHSFTQEYNQFFNIMMKLLILSTLLVNIMAFAPLVPLSQSKTTTQLQETFGLGIGEDTYENQPVLLRGEQEYKQFVNKYKEDNMLNRKYNVIGRVRELNLLQATVDNGILSKLEANGLDLATIEKLLPVAEDLGLLSLAGSNQQLLVNLAAPLLIEPAPYLIPVIAGALEKGPSAFFGAAAVLIGFDALLISNDVEVPFVGLPAGVVLGLLLVPLAGVLGVVGVSLAGLKK